jgi:hypothetical protein
MRRFILIRDIDVTGVSGTGVVIWGVEWPDGRVSYRWHSDTATSVNADNISHVEAVHSHDGATRLVWLDSELAASRWKRYVQLGDAALPGTLRGTGR